MDPPQQCNDGDSYIDLNDILSCTSISDNDETDVPLNLPSLGNISASTAHRFTCASLIDGTIKCWGYNINGQLGDGLLQIV